MNSPSLSAICAFGDLLEQAQERLDKALHMLPEDEAASELKSLDELWELYQSLSASWPSDNGGVSICRSGVQPHTPDSNR